MYDYNVLWVHSGEKYVEVRQDKDFLCLISVVEVDRNGKESTIHTFNEPDMAISFAKKLTRKKIISVDYA